MLHAGKLPIGPDEDQNRFPSPSATLEVDSDGRWFIDARGKTVSLQRLRLMQRIVAALVDRRVRRPGESVTTDELFRLAWSTHNIRPASAQARVYMAVSRLRALGLADALTHDRTGYLIDPDVEVRVHAPGAPTPTVPVPAMIHG